MVIPGVFFFAYEEGCHYINCSFVGKFPLMAKKIKDWALPIAMILGCLFYPFFVKLAFLLPYMLWAMLFVTYCRLSMKDVVVRPLHIWLVAVQLLGAVCAYYLFGLISPLIGEGILICILAPTANSAAVITSMLGGNLGMLAAYTLFSNVVVAVSTPVLFPLLGISGDISFMSSFSKIVMEVSPMLLLPLAAAYLALKFFPKFHAKVKSHQSISFYLWAVSLVIVSARTLDFILVNGKGNAWIMAILAIGSLVVCLLQFWVGRLIGRKYGDVVSGGQALGQKNTVLAIWMAQSYMQPLASIGPATYILWHNIVNTYQLWVFRSKASKS